jgi:hypothetical protein
MLKKEWCTFGRKKNICKKQGLNALNMQKLFWFMLSFEHVNFIINGNIPKKLMTIQPIMLPMWFFKHIKM